MNDLPVTLEQLSARLVELEQRVSLLEHPCTDNAAAVAMEDAASQAPPAGDSPSLAQAGGLFYVLGKAMLGIAGAYVLRAVAESTSLPKLAIAVVAIVYALLWLVGAVRVPAQAWLGGTVYACTSALILAPMLWELTLSFKVLAPSATAAILALFVTAASALAWKRDLAPVLWVANGTAAASALVLAVATHQLIPFLAVLLLMVLLCEGAAQMSHELSLRPFVAAAADVAVWALIYIYASPQITRTDYPPLGMAALLVPSCVLFVLHAASLGSRTALLGQNITVFEIVQAIIAFLLSAASVLYFAPQFGALGLGVVCLLLSAACIAMVFAVFKGFAAGRNPQVFAAWSTALLMTGSLLCLPVLAQALVLGLAATASTVLGVRLGRLALLVHGLLLLVSAAIASGLLGYAFQALAGTMPDHLAASVWIAAVCALICYAAGKRAAGETWQRQLLHLVPAALSVCALAAMLVQGLLVLASLRITPEVHHVAFLRTLILCAVTLAVAFAGARWQRLELTRIAYASLALLAAKLLLEDLRHGHLAFIAAAFFLFALTLIAVPRLARTGHKI